MGEGAVRARAVPVQGAALSVTASPRIGLGETIQIRGPTGAMHVTELPFETGAGERGRGEIVAGLLAFFQAFPKPACFCPSFSKDSFGRFVGFQGVASPKNLKDVAPNFFVGSRLRSAVFPPPPRRILPPTPHGSEGGRPFAGVGQGAGSWRRNDPDRENYEPSMDSDC